MGCFSSKVSSTLLDGLQTAAAFAPVPGLGPAAALLRDIIDLCAAVPQNKHAARRLADRCQNIYNALEQYEKKPIPDRAIEPRDAVFKCLSLVKDTMHKWSQEVWYYMLLYQGDFEAEFDDCNTAINDCLTVFGTVAHMETLVHQKDTEKWRRDLKESQDADQKAIMEQFAAADFTQRVAESKLMESQNDIKAILAMMQKGLGQHNVVSDEGRMRMAKNLYKLLQLSNSVPPECELNSGEIEWSGEVPIEGGAKNVDMYKGKYLQSEEVRIKVIRSVNMKDGDTVKRIRREVELWAEIHAADKGKHIIPFYGFYSPDGIRLALVSPWVDNGNALEYVKKYDYGVDYKKLIIGISAGIKVLHSMKPPIIHGNLRAEKVLVGTEGQPLITDFALAKLEGNLITQTTGESDSCRWCAPEMFEEQATVSAKGDIYSFGMTILQLYTHEIPYVNISKTFHVYSKKRKGDGLPDRPQGERVIERGLDDAMWALLCQCWSKDPETRPSIDELEKKLLDPMVQEVQPPQEPVAGSTGNMLGIEQGGGGEGNGNTLGHEEEKKDDAEGQG